MLTLWFKNRKDIPERYDVNMFFFSHKTRDYLILETFRVISVKPYPLGFFFRDFAKSAF